MAQSIRDPDQSPPPAAVPQGQEEANVAVPKPSNPRKRKSRPSPFFVVLMLLFLMGAGGYFGYGWASANGYLGSFALQEILHPIKQKLGLAPPPGTPSSPFSAWEKEELATTPLAAKPEEKQPATAVKKPEPEQAEHAALNPEDQLRKAISEKPESPASDYLELARILEESGKRKQAGNTLKSALEYHPENRDLLLTLADNLDSQGRETEAWLLLARTGVYRDPEFAHRIMKLGLATGYTDETLVIVDPGSANAPAWNDDDRVLIGRLNESVGNYQAALEIFSQLPGGENESIRVKARQSHQSGKNEEALAFQIDYVNRLPAPDADALTYLSELHRLNGNKEEADKAYQLAVGALHGAR